MSGDWFLDKNKNSCDIIMPSDLFFESTIWLMDPMIFTQTTPSI